MKSYTITVNGTAYEVTVEETGSVSAPAAAPKAAPKAAPAAAPKAAAPAAGAGAVKVTASVPGKVVKVAASVGQAVKAGDSVIILESMKMEIPVVAQSRNIPLILTESWQTVKKRILPSVRSLS